MLRRLFKTRKTMIATLLVLVGVVAVGTTAAILSARSGSVENTFTLGEVNTHLEENIDPDPVEIDKKMLKQPYVVNDGPSNAYVRARITISPSDAGVKLYAGTWSIAGTELDPYNMPSDLSGKSFSETDVVFDEDGFKDNGNWIYNPDDGFYYYTLVTSSDAASEYNKTATLFDAVSIKENANVTVYQESLFVTKVAGTEVSVADIAAEFDAAENK